MVVDIGRLKGNLLPLGTRFELLARWNFFERIRHFNILISSRRALLLSGKPLCDQLPVESGKLIFRYLRFKMVTDSLFPLSQECWRD